MNRRDFVKTSSAASLGYVAAPLIKTVPRFPMHRTALIGTGWWGMNILRTAIAAGQSEVIAMCDVDENQLGPARADVEHLTGNQPKAYKDFRDMLATEKPEVVIVGTPDHWHALAAIAAIESGAHVYLEKPISHTHDEGRAILNAARRHERIVQIGTHRRVSPHNISAMNFLRAGNLGTIGTVRAFVHYGGGPGEVTPDSEPPAGLDWDMWCGPAPLRPYNERIHPRGFRQFLDFANGQLGDWGIHWLDQILWWTEEKAPHTVFSTGNRYIRRDTTDAPDAQVATFQFETFTATWEHRLFAANNAEKTNIGCYFYGTRGTLHLGWLDGWTFYPTNSRDPIYHEDPQFHEPDQQNIPELWADFMDAIQHNRRPACDVEEGYHATSMCLLAMISMNVGRSLKWDADTGKILNDPEASKLLRRPYRAPWVYPSPG